MTEGLQNAGEYISNEPSNIKASDGVTPKAHVSYIGFESMAGGRHLRFRVKPSGQAAIQVTFDVPDTDFTGTFGVSIQDAAPMAYEKLLELLTTEHRLDTTSLCLTVADIANYINRHRSHKHGHSTDGRQRQSKIAA